MPTLNLGPIQLDLRNLVIGDPHTLRFTSITDAAGDPVSFASMVLTAQNRAGQALGDPVDGVDGAEGVDFDLTDICAAVTSPQAVQYRIVADGTTVRKGSIELRLPMDGRGLSSSLTTTQLVVNVILGVGGFLIVDDGDGNQTVQSVFDDGDGTTTPTVFLDGGTGS